MKKLALALALLGAMASAQSDFVQPGSIGTSPAPMTSCKFEGTNRPPITCWPGQKVLFLPSPLSLQKYGYQSFKGGTGSFGNVGYQEGVGRIGTVTKVSAGQYSGFDVEIKMDDNGQIYVGHASGSDPLMANVDGIALLTELQAARSALKGKDVWLSTKYIGQYDAEMGKVSSLLRPRFQKYTVQDVVAGWYGYSPVRLIVKSQNGEIGFEDIAYTGYNSGSLWEISAFDRNVSLVDPRTVKKWKPEVWKALENDTVIPGMTMEQVVYGYPWDHTVSKSTSTAGTVEVWGFDKFGTITFVNGIVTTFSR